MDNKCKNYSRLMGSVSEELGLVALKSSIKGSLNTIAHAGCGFILENLEGKKSTLQWKNRCQPLGE